MPRGKALRVAVILLSIFGAAALAVAILNNDSSPGEASPLNVFGTPAPAQTATAPATSRPTATTEVSAATFAHAADLLRDGSYEDAATAFAALVASPADAELGARAAVQAAVAQDAAGHRDTARTTLAELLATAPPGSESRRQATFMLATWLNDDGTSEAAVQAGALLQPLAAAPVGDALDSYIRNEYARSLALAGDEPDADATWDGLLADPALPESLRTDIYTARLDIAKAHSDDVATRQWLTKLVAATGDTASRYDLATRAQSAGDNGTFVAQMSAIITGSPASSQALLAVAALEAAGISVDPGAEGLVDYRHGLYSDAIALLSTAIDEPGIDAATLTFRAFYLGAANEDSGNTVDAVRYYDIAANAGAGTAYTHRAKYWAARVTEGRGDRAGASARYVDLVLHGPAGEFTSEAAFRAGYTLLQGGDATGAVSAWSRLGATNDARLLYWKGRADSQLGDAAAARLSYAAAAQAAPLDFYGQEAATALSPSKPFDVTYRSRMLDTSIDWGAISAWLNSKVPGTSVVATSGAETFVTMGMDGRARQALLDAADGAGPWTLLTLLQQAHDAGLPDVAAQLALRLRLAANVADGDEPAALLRLEYPLDFVPTLQAESKAAGIDPLFFAALIRQESLWDPAAGSSAGALGLTQVIPPTGQGIADALGVEGFVADDLFRPSISLRFGAYYAGEQLRQYGGDPLAALAAYNAGPSNAARWLAAASPTPADFVEGVDIPETQHYVEVILEHYAHYLKAYGP